MLRQGEQLKNNVQNERESATTTDMVGRADRQPCLADIFLQASQHVEYKIIGLFLTFNQEIPNKKTTIRITVQI